MSYWKFYSSELKQRIEDRFGGTEKKDSAAIDYDEWRDLVQTIQDHEQHLDEIYGFKAGPFHVIPLNDEKDHQESVECWCMPYVDAERSDLYIHNSADGRENLESDRKMH